MASTLGNPPTLMGALSLVLANTFASASAAWQGGRAKNSFALKRENCWQRVKTVLLITSFGKATNFQAAFFSSSIENQQSLSAEVARVRHYLHSLSAVTILGFQKARVQL